jgi:hypothetical protein
LNGTGRTASDDETFLVTDVEEDRRLWVAALTGEHMYTYVQNTGRFHDNNALRNDYFMVRELDYRSISVTEAHELIADGVGQADEDLMDLPLANWRRDPDALQAEEVFAAVIADIED